MLLNCLFVAGGGAIGAVLRYLVSQFIITPTCAFPVATFVINFTACFLMGLTTEAAQLYDILEPRTLLLLTTGIYGGFSTLSAFSEEALDLFINGRIWLAGGYVTATFVLCLFAVVLGRYALMSVAVR